MDFSNGNRDGRGSPPTIDPPEEPKERRWITRREAAAILGCSRDNVRRLEGIGLLHSKPDRHGTRKIDRREVEAYAAKRGRGVQRVSGSLTARVFRLIKAGASFEDICIETEQSSVTIRQLWRDYLEGFNAADDPQTEAKGREELARREREQREYDEQMLQLEEELERRRRRVRGGTEPEPPAPPAPTPRNGKKPRSGRGK